MKKPTGVREKKRQQLFTRRSYQMYRNMESRARLLLGASFQMPYQIEEFRDFVKLALNAGPLKYGTHSKCPYFPDEDLTVRNFSIDHRVPLSRLADEYKKEGHNWENLIVCSKSANLAKGEMTDTEFRALLDVLYSERFTAASRKDVIGRLKAGASIKRLRFLRR